MQTVAVCRPQIGPLYGVPAGSFVPVMVGCTSNGQRTYTKEKYNVGVISFTHI